MLSLRTAVIFLALAASVMSQTSGAAKSDSVQLALNRAVAEARVALNTYGESDSAMRVIEGVLSEVAALPGLKTRAEMKDLHGGKNMKRGLLATEGDSGICLYISWFGEGAATPVHNHLTWGVLRLLEGADRYARWQRLSSMKADSVAVEKTEERIINVGESVYWLGPPLDMHTQSAVKDDTWELVMTGRDLGSPYVREHQSKFDPKTGKALSANPQH
jgi:hypothetical protein